jgi:hypothetical protein
MLVDKLHMLVTLQQDREIIKPGNDTLEFHSVDEKHGDGCVGFADIVQKQFLKVPALIVGHLSSSFAHCNRNNIAAQCRASDRGSQYVG